MAFDQASMDDHSGAMKSWNETPSQSNLRLDRKETDGDPAES
jgi:hypothetical protein